MNGDAEESSTIFRADGYFATATTEIKRQGTAFAKNVGRHLVRASINELVEYSANTLLFPGAGEIAVSIAPVDSIVDYLIPV